MNDHRSVAFVTLGCAKNEVDTRRMHETLLADGYRIVNDINECDCVVVNTCAFIESAAQESIDQILDLAGDSSLKSRGVGIVVAGCLPSRFGSDLEDALEEARVYVPCDEEGSIADAIEESIRIAESNRIDDEHAANCDSYLQADVPHGLPYAYVKISDGCSRFCSYCTIPFIRGPYRSISLTDIDAECTKLIDEGIREIVLIGQDTGLWGSDIEDGRSLAELLEFLSHEHPDTWFRVMYTQPENVTDKLLEVIGRTPNICPYLDIPMQHCVQHILKDMNRTGSRESLDTLISKIRATVPKVAIRTTLMCGFPGETEEDFEELIDFVESSRFDYVGVFAFSPEEGTRAASMPDAVSEDEKQYRAERLRTIADAISTSVIAERIGEELPYLCEGIEDDGQAFGRCIIQAPEVDGVTYCDEVELGAIDDIEVLDTFMYDMEATLIDR